MHGVRLVRMPPTNRTAIATSGLPESCALRLEKSTTKSSPTVSLPREQRGAKLPPPTRQPANPSTRYMAASLIYVMKALRKVVPPSRIILDDIWLSFYPDAKI